MRFIEHIKRHVKDQRYLYWVFIGMYILPNVLMFFTESTSTMVRVCNILVPLSFYCWAFTWLKKPGKTFWILYFFSFLAGFQIVLLYLYGESPIAVDMFQSTFTSNPAEGKELLSNLFPAVMFVLVVYVGGMVLAVLSILNKETLTHRFRQLLRKVALVIFGTTLLMLGFTYAFDRCFKIQNDVFPINAIYNLMLSVERTSKTMDYDKNTLKFSFGAKSLHPASESEVYVLIVGETLRAGNLGIYGYHRNTTPLLGAMANDLAVYRDALTMSNTTYKSVPLLLTSVGSDDDFDGIYSQKGIISAFKEAGFKTAFISNQRRNHSIIDRLAEEADCLVYLKDGKSLMANVIDEKLVKQLKQQLQSYHGGKLFVVLHCYGSHFNYYDRYSRSEAYYKPDIIPSAEKQYRSNMVNAYDNTVRMADKVAAGVVELLKGLKVPAAMVMLSDHGEDIFDDSRQRFLHSSPLPTYYQLRVPFVVWTSKQFQAAYPDKWQTLLTNRDLPISTNRVAFHTLLDLGGVATSYFKPQESVCNASFVPTRRRYVNDHNDFCTLDQVGLKQLDLEQFEENNIQYP